MRPLVRQECKSLDDYLAAKKLPSVHVAETFDLLRVSEATGEEEPPELRRARADRLATLGRE
eukprot:CAMPEP_0115333718 /NCGR_PEP_ID=MMETSP0270-20121206/87524_1 /TAXON_ID=71861 /ORGANISM="Scrippsiella trochoidea, Strain CCMP3099" /LENGTH=61 /DNA_ID=CAMNT_0002754647 /DNA_START=14 /DNA_END=196 /DNA_ORIENTATION=-